MKPCLFDLQILADKLELALQGDLVLLPFEGHAQQVAEADQQTARSIDVFLHQDSNGVKTVEQKCGCKLPFRVSSLALEAWVSRLPRLALRPHTALLNGDHSIPPQTYQLR